MRRRLVIALSVLAAGVTAGAAVQSCLAEEAAPAAAAAAEHAASAGHGGDHATAGAGKAERRSGEDRLNDNLVSAPSRANAVHEKAAKAGVVIGSPRNLLGRPVAVPRPAQATTRNSIGVLVPRPAATDAHMGQQREAPAKLHGFGFAASGGAPQAGGLSFKVDRPSPLPATHIAPAVRPVAVNRSAINGTSLIHAGSAPAGIGGPAKVVGGINGSAIRPAH